MVKPALPPCTTHTTTPQRCCVGGSPAWVMTLTTPLLLMLVARVATFTSHMTYYNVGVLMASRLDSPFDLERCGPAIDLALDEINDRFLAAHRVRLTKVQERLVQTVPN